MKKIRKPYHYNKESKGNNMLYFDYTFSITDKVIKFEDQHPDEMLRSEHVQVDDLYRVQLDELGRIVLVKLDPVYSLVVDA